MVEIRRQDGNEYPPPPNRYIVDFYTRVNKGNAPLAGFQQVFDAEMKWLKSAGLDVSINRVEPITETRQKE